MNPDNTGFGAASPGPSTSGLIAFEVVGDPETLAGCVVHLSGGLLGILQLGDLLLDLTEFNLDLSLEILDLCLGLPVKPDISPPCATELGTAPESSSTSEP
jgi:hypothetical protein